MLEGEKVRFDCQALVQRSEMGEVMQRHGKRWSRGGSPQREKGEGVTVALHGARARPRLGVSLWVLVV